VWGIGIPAFWCPPPLQGPPVSSYVWLGLAACFDALLVTIVMGLTQRLKRAVPELLFIALMRFDVIAYLCSHDAREAHRAKRVF
jgi:predicted membrane protein